ncbi:MAG TPA: asparagine synthase (glutamine-hydrolyzing) [Tepidisphaeraceae bacterium]|jgi:asparagine synthase (glutamine-hydrolysing)|nr:asparagine synthase (glutamine-hydrolyzing) [Tepidisphaeraceae bacterium]
MCGIAGIITLRQEMARRALPAMVACQKHRGPDDSGEIYLPFGERFLGLGHRRLSILDLTAAGHQPMTHPITGDRIIFNGEIYNFLDLRKELEELGEKFVGHCDTEVMLHALARWGPEAIRKFAGMYAFAFYDVKRDRLILGRDPLGIKPLYVAEVDGVFLFASELRSILASDLVPRKLDRQAVAGMLAYGAVQEPSTIVQRVRMFPAGHYQVYDAKTSRGAEPAPFWDFPRPRAGMTQMDAVESVRETLDLAVRDHLVADVPVGVFLSSGLDSTIIAGLAARHTRRLRSFTVSFADAPDMSERALADETARLFGLEQTNIDISAADAQSAAVAWLGALDQPSIDGLNVYVISKAVRGQGIAVALSGQGGDELFGGYPSFSDVPRIRRLLSRMKWMAPGVRAGMMSIASAGKSRTTRQKLADMSRTDGGVLALALQRRRAMTDDQLAALGLRAADLGLDQGFHLFDATADIQTNGADAIAEISQIESRFYQGNMLLRDSDVNGMAHSLEIRVPILDQRVAELAYGIPGSIRLPKGKADKHLLRTAFPDLLRPQLLSQGKRGFSLPIRRWMLGPLRELCEQGLAHLKSQGLLKPEGIDAVWHAFLREPETPIWSRAFALCVLGLHAKKLGLTVS